MDFDDIIHAIGDAIKQYKEGAVTQEELVEFLKDHAFILSEEVDPNEWTAE